MKKTEKAIEVVSRLRNEYPLAECTLDAKKAYELLFAVRLAAQCTDARVNIVCEELYRKFPTLESIAGASVEEIEAIVHPCGLYHTKARDISASAKMLVEVYGGVVPDTMEELLKLPGVGRKSANLILGDVYGKPAVVTDTHCIRIANRLGLCSTKEPAKVETALRKLLPPEQSNDTCHRFVMHGRAVCRARGPICENCCLREVCDRVGVEK